ncbi:hypothetical protein JCM10449v2_005019 [Rhodotorula kratochvilovae]
MPPRPPPHQLSLLALVLLLVLITPARALSPRPRAATGAKTPPGVSPAGDYLCRIGDDCAPCPPDELATPVCKLYGNRRPLACVPRLGAAHPPASASSAERGAGSRAPSGGGSWYAAPPPEDVGLEDARGEGQAGAREDDAAAARVPLSPAEQELRDALNADRVRLVRREEWDAELARRQVHGGGGVVVHTWEACPKVLRQEYHDYFEFIMCNLAFAAVGLALLVYRQRTLALRQFGRLAARIMQTEMT